MATIRDVAKVCGVSYQTVSNTLNSPAAVRPATRERVMRAVQEVGLRVPEDVSVTGFDDLAPAALTTPPLTTMRQPLRALGKRAVEIVMKIKEEPEWVCREVLSTELVGRQSVALKSGH